MRMKQSVITTVFLLASVAAAGPTTTTTISTRYLSLGSLPAVVGGIYNPDFLYTNLTTGGGQYILSGSILGIDPPSAGWPVVIAYHGGRETSYELMRYTDFANLSAVVIAPLGQPSQNNHTWISAFPWLFQPPRNDAAFINAVLQDVITNFESPLDLSRVYVTGKSDGAGMASFTVQHSELFNFDVRGISTVSGAFFGIENDVGYASYRLGRSTYRFPPQARDYQKIGLPKDPIPILDFHGTKDTIMPYTGKIFENPLMADIYDVVGNFFTKTQGFMNQVAHTADILAYYAIWSAVVNGITQETIIERFTTPSTSNHKVDGHKKQQPRGVSFDKVATTHHDHDHDHGEAEEAAAHPFPFPFPSPFSSTDGSNSSTTMDGQQTGGEEGEKPFPFPSNPLTNGSSGSTLDLPPSTSIDSSSSSATTDSPFPPTSGTTNTVDGGQEGEGTYLYTWFGGGASTSAPVQHIQVPGGEHCWYGHEYIKGLHCGSSLNQQLDATYIIAHYFQIPLSTYTSPAPPSTTVPYVANPSGLIDLSYQPLVAPGTTHATVTATLWHCSKNYNTIWSTWVMGFFEILNYNGDVTDPRTGAVLSPGDNGWVMAALNADNIVWLPASSDPSRAVTFELVGRKIYASFVMTQQDSNLNHVSTPFQASIGMGFIGGGDDLKVMNLGSKSFAYQAVDNNQQPKGDRLLFRLKGIDLY